MAHKTVELIERLLNDNRVVFERFDHAPVRTSEEAAEVRGDFSLSQGAKALIVRVKKGSEKFFAMVVVPGDKKFDSKKLREVLGASDIRFATPEEVEELTEGVLPGGVPPFGNLWGIPVYSDISLYENEKIIFNAGNRSVSITIASKGYKKVVQPHVVSIV